jgi:hypothetical protein
VIAPLGQRALVLNLSRIDHVFLPFDVKRRYFTKNRPRLQVAGAQYPQSTAYIKKKTAANWTMAAILLPGVRRGVTG